ncbi:MAG TPA: RNA polymerase sigma-70 factor [Chryseolinea sp.]|nr:RNA polymerase sigma-70 factor [Chryseolinea sp.]
MTQDEWKAVRATLKKDEGKAFELIYNHFWRKFYAVSFNYVRDKGTAEEIVQEVFLRLWIKRDRLHHVDNINAFGMRTLQNYIYDYFDKKAVAERYLLMASLNSVRHVDNIHPQLEYEETYKLINKELDSLPDTTRKIFRLSRFDQLSNEEIASAQQLSVKAVEYHITRSLRHLRLRLANLLLHSIILVFLLLDGF